VFKDLLVGCGKIIKKNILNKKTLVLTSYLVFFFSGKMIDIITLDNEFD